MESVFALPWNRRSLWCGLAVRFAWNTQAGVYIEFLASFLSSYFFSSATRSVRRWLHLLYPVSVFSRAPLVLPCWLHRGSCQPQTRCDGLDVRDGAVVVAHCDLAQL
ncbi:hypothetical protein Bphy_7671 (plasmid) [Paraburkholderia phymatum STM815]|uniref:Uncharacterized protein n=1 Tax=Paraburkholderia phymatum (strain DSM 17167 / CIP 108236 / LMG 21445 / STM815) TaxID=391038 RepID=B2JY67_PARP8|nr:hypothetical protein Bphy_7671 [Paraburkholderia phymatum STM815]